MKELHTTAIILCCSLVLGCSEDETHTPPAAPTVTFVSDDVPAGSAVYLRAAAVSPQRLSLELVGQQLSDVYGVALRLEYSGDVLSYGTLTAGGGWGGQITLPAGKEVAPGLLVGAVTQRGDAPGIAMDDDVLAQVELPLAALASTPVQLGAGHCAVVSGDGSEVDGVSWSGGQLIVQ